MTKKELKKEYFDKLCKVLEEEFEKGEKCQCGRKLPCRSKALVLNSYANIYLLEALKSQNQDLLKKCIVAIDKARQDMLELDNETQNNKSQKTLRQNP